MVKYNSVTSPEMDNIMRRVEGTEKGLEVLQAKVTDVENTLDVLRKEVTDIGNRLSGLEIKVVGLTEKLDNFIEIATRYVQHHRPQFKTCSKQLLGGH